MLNRYARMTRSNFEIVESIMTFFCSIGPVEEKASASFTRLTFIFDFELIEVPVLRELTTRPNVLVCGRTEQFCTSVRALFLSAAAATLCFN